MSTHFIGYLKEEAPFYLFIVQTLLAGVSLYGLCSNWRADHLNLVILLVSPSMPENARN